MDLAHGMMDSDEMAVWLSTLLREMGVGHRLVIKCRPYGPYRKSPKDWSPRGRIPGADAVPTDVVVIQAAEFGGSGR